MNGPYIFMADNEEAIKKMILSISQQKIPAALQNPEWKKLVRNAANDIIQYTEQ